ncbi:hypothetical protein EON64_11170 [archaeon]|nr:MAG: hypothetical protein EON64_11170 [archaeon]
MLGRKDLYGRLSDMQRDQVSHFILRLAYCPSEELRRWFITQECALFKHRLDELADEERAQFMYDNGLQYDRVDPSEKRRLEDKLIDIGGVTTASFPATHFYKVPFAQALALLGSRAVYLERGLVYVPLQKLVSILVMRFRSLLSRALAEAAGLFDLVRADPRIAPFLQVR